MWVHVEARDDPLCLGIEFRSFGCTMGTELTYLSSPIALETESRDHSWPAAGQ